MPNLFHTVRCEIMMPDEAEDFQTVIDIPGGMNQTETLKFWAGLEDQYGAVNIEIMEEDKKWLWWHT